MIGSRGKQSACCSTLLDANVGAILPYASKLRLALSCMSAVSRTWPVHELSDMAALRSKRTLRGSNSALRAFESKRSPSGVSIQGASGVQG
eukprot:5781193-Amphidinium_carterae.1